MRHVKSISAILGFLLVSASPVFAVEICNLTDRSTQEVVPGVILRWDSSFHCLEAQDAEQYNIVVQVFNASSSAEAVTIGSLDLSHTTPRPRGQAPAATADATGPGGLPITVAPGETMDFTVTGEYALVKTDQGKKANLHLLAHGVGVSIGEPFELGINVHIRAPGATE